MSNKSNNSGSNTLMGYFAGAAIIVALLTGVLIYTQLMGNPANFEGGDVVKGHPTNFLGIFHRGGFIVPLLLAVNIIVILVSIERFISMKAAQGKGSTTAFIHAVRNAMGKNDLDGAIAICDKQQGSLANVVRSGLTRYQIVKGNDKLTRDEKKTAIEKELEEATSLELPMLSRNLVVIATCVSIGTLIGLIGTVFGMIRAFAALANAGAPDTAALATGISEALVNTASGIVASTLAVIAYNYFSNRVDSMTHSMDEASYSIVSNFQANHE
ncbi:MAG: MotA/TolQ/ExbB proton channel family protein [Bacteroidetes bacterium]|jgi:biopolymer transport protein ExbB|nr:MotA/TolQ/ExbB proton channel family protein [Bacteroidota bacterium]MDA0943040.1 MotA/TolQ/ExbB proton channel family protein [Bacteroidota bacterium]MDA1111588.1 MotA/TolQ/ExbB proton channel family protein [Bacteroidota bacterium]